jgi:hypothetical protein
LANGRDYNSTGLHGRTQNGWLGCGTVCRHDEPDRRPGSRTLQSGLRPSHTHSPIRVGCDGWAGDGPGWGESTMAAVRRFAAATIGLPAHEPWWGAAVMGYCGKSRVQLPRSGVASPDAGPTVAGGDCPVESRRCGIGCELRPGFTTSSSGGLDGSVARAGSCWPCSGTHVGGSAGTTLRGNSRAAWPGLIHPSFGWLRALEPAFGS